MKKSFLCIILAAFLTGLNSINSQDVSLKESIDSINAILKDRPYHDGFNDISFYYSIDITNDMELVVEMNFDGPFKWIYKAKISDLDLEPDKDICSESPNSICWTCKQSDPSQPVSCVQAEIIMTDGGSEKENATNICVSFSGRNQICNELKNKFNNLFNNVKNSKQQEIIMGR